MKDVLLVLAGGATVAVINGIFNLLTHKQERQAVKEDQDYEQFKGVVTELLDKVEKIIKGQRYVMYDRIKFLAQAYIKEGCVDFDDRRILHKMHTIYHNDYDGNGDLDILMEKVDDLPLKEVEVS